MPKINIYTNTITSSTILQKSIFILLIIIFFTSSPYFLYCQKETGSITLKSNYRQGDFGVFAGIGQSTTTGNILSTCNLCNFPDGLGRYYNFGLDYYYYFDPTLFICGSISYENMSLNSSFLSKESIVLEEYQNELVDISMRNNLDANFQNLQFGLYAGLKIFYSFTLKGGISLGLPMQSSLYHKNTLLTKTAILSNGEVVGIGLDPDNNNKPIIGENFDEVIIQNIEFPELNNPVFLNLSVGRIFYFNKSVFLHPQFQYSASLNPISNYGEDLMIQKWQLRLELLINHRRVLQ